MNLQDNIENFVRERFFVDDDDPEFGRTVDLWEAGYVDSTGMVEVVTYLEELAGERIPDEIMMSTRLSTIEGMAGVVEQVRRSTGVSLSA